MTFVLEEKFKRVHILMIILYFIKLISADFPIKNHENYYLTQNKDEKNSSNIELFNQGKINILNYTTKNRIKCRKNLILNKISNIKNFFTDSVKQYSLVNTKQDILFFDFLENKNDENNDYINFNNINDLSEYFFQILLESPTILNIINQLNNRIEYKYQILFKDFFFFRYFDDLKNICLINSKNNYDSFELLYFEKSKYIEDFINEKKNIR